MLGQLLARHGYDVQTALGGLECLCKLRCFAPHALVLSVELLWGGSGGVLARLRDGELPAVPVVLVSTDERCQDAAALSGPPVRRCLLKPFSLDTLLDSIRSAIAAPREDRHVPAETTSRRAS